LGKNGANDVTRDDDGRFGVDVSETVEEGAGAFDLVGRWIGSVRRSSSGTDLSSHSDDVAPFTIREPARSLTEATIEVRGRRGKDVSSNRRQEERSEGRLTRCVRP